MARRTRQPESAVLAACLDLLRLRGVLCWRSNNVPVYDRRTGRYRAFNGLKGVSDILAVLKGGKLLAIETKSDSGRLTAEQEWFLGEVQAQGGAAIVVRSVGELADFLDRLEDVQQ